MPNLERLLDKLRNARGLVRFKDIEYVLTVYGYVYAGMKGSHVRFEKESALSLHFPVHNEKVKHYYVNRIINILVP